MEERPEQAKSAPASPAPSLTRFRQETAESFLVRAAEEGDLAAVLSVLAEGVPAGIQDRRYASTPLHGAAAAGHAQVVAALLDAGAEVNHPDVHGTTALSDAARHGHVEVVTLLLKRGADIDPVDENGSTPLNSAIAGRHIE
ncbi:MAG: arf-GAP with coiled-coil, repeat and protein 3-like, partial [Geminicoccaceae bacterium]|nr:arf-GAP with coiled-coil, repeat and protein 3-like [Geminicoccaceae bacterium]